MDKKAITGRGAMLIRVSKGIQEKDNDESRQYADNNHWLKDHKLIVSPEDVYRDVGSRSKADERAEFQRLVAAVQRGRYQWVVVDDQDRFGTFDADEWGYYRYLFRKVGCDLYESISGENLTSADAMTRIKTGLKADASQKEVSGKGLRSLGQLILYVQQGRWPGGHIPYGMDVVCFSEAGAPKWRLIHQGRAEGAPIRIKLLPNGERQEYRGKFNVPPTDQKDYLSLRPTEDATKLDALHHIFKWFASEAISAPAIGRRLNKMGIKPTYADVWDGADIRQLLRNKVYIGIQTFAKASRGDHYEVRGGRVVERQTRDYQTRDSEDHVESKQLFDPVIPMSLWDRVQLKIKSTPPKKHVPRSSSLWLAGLVRCAGCGRNMRGVSNGGRKTHKPQYMCSSYGDSKITGVACACNRNGVDHEIVESFVRKYVSESGADVSLVLEAERSGNLTILKPLIERQMSGIRALVETHKAMVGEVKPEFVANRLMTLPVGEIEYYDCLQEELEGQYRRMFASAESGLHAELERLDLVHTRLTQAYQGIVGERARAKVNIQIADLEAKMDDLEDRTKNAADKAQELRAELVRLSEDLAVAETSVEGDDQRRCAAAVGRVIDHVLCRFVATGRKCPTSSLVEVVVVPKSGDAVRYPFDGSRRAPISISSARSGSY